MPNYAEAIDSGGGAVACRDFILRYGAGLLVAVIAVMSLAATAIQCQAAKDHVQLNIAPRAGRYNGMPSQRNYDIRIHAAKPESVSVNGNKSEWTYESPTGSVCLTAIEDTSRKTPIVVEVGM